MPGRARAGSPEWRIFETRQFLKDLEVLARAGREDVERRLRSVVYPRLRMGPRWAEGARKLRGYKPETWRIRIASWRFFYEIDVGERIVFMIAASHRGSAY